MSNFNTPRPAEEDLSQSSDEKMDTGSESFRSQDTPNSVLSSDFEDRSLDNNVLRLQNPQETEANVLRLSEPENDNRKPKPDNLTDSFVTKMSHLQLDSPIRPRHLGVSPPKFSTPLVLTTNHPLMEPFPDVIPKEVQSDDAKELSLSSVEESRQTNGYDFYSPPMNTSKNNLYFSENFTAAAEGVNLDTCLPPDVARVRRKIVPLLRKETEESPCVANKFAEGVRMVPNQSTPKQGGGVDIPEIEFCSGVADWCESPSHLHSIPNFELPIELSTNIGVNNAVNNGLDSPDLLSSSTQEDKSAYQALLDPYTGSVALRPTKQRSPATQRRRIQVPPDEDVPSLDSISVSMDSDDEPLELEGGPVAAPAEDSPSDDENKLSHSTNTGSECSDQIPEYSAADELRRERSWLSVDSGGRTATCDMKVIEPFKRVLSHGGYDARGAAVIVFSACHLPHNARADYRYVMDNLFLYVIWTLERLVTDEYILVYLHGSAGGGRMPTFRWLQECYRLIDRRLRKSLKHLYLVHPTFWLKTFVLLTKPFVSSKFFRKLSYVRSLSELQQKVHVEPNAIPDIVKQFDAAR